MHTVVETRAYLSSVKAVGMTAAETKDALDTVARDPKAGDLIVGSEGCRKLRVAGRGKGKSGAYRVVTYFERETAPAFLLSVLSKGSDANFSAAQINALAKVTATIVESLGPRALG